MKKKLLALVGGLLIGQTLFAQEPIVLKVPAQNIEKNVEERITMRGDEKIISGVTEPTISVYLPSAEKNTGTAVILCSGGAMRFHSWTNDVERMAQFLNERGIAAIGLKYRLNNSNPSQVTMGAIPDMVDVTGFQKFPKANANPMPSVEGDKANMNAILDAREAIKLVRAHAAEWNINPDKVGFLGFSAGGGVAVGATVLAQAGEMPNFLVSVYGPSFIDVEVPANAPNLLILTRAEHPNVAAGLLQLFLEWKKAGKNAELHMYGDGKGPFALADRKGKNTTDTWSDDLMSWLEAKGFVPQTSNYVQVEDGGSGPYKAVVDRSAEAPDYTLYHPANMAYAVSKEGPLPLVLFANGGCSFTSKHFEKYLTEIASHGYMVAAVGSYDELTDEQIKRLGMTDTEYMVHAIDVMEKLNADPQSAFYQQVNVKQIVAMGQSCGGGQSLSGSVDPRVTLTVALNSGFSRLKPPFPVEEPGINRPAEGPKGGFAKKVSEGGLYGKEFGGTMTQADLVKLHAPVAYLIGGPDDVAYPNANQNFELINHVPVVLCNLPVGHMATYDQHHGGAFAEITLKWLDWHMKGKTEASKFFLDEAYQKEKYPKWTVQRKNWK